MQQSHYRFLPCILVVLVLGQRASGLECEFEDTASIQAAGGRVIGNAVFVDGRFGKAGDFTNGWAAVWSVSEHFDPRSGTVDMWVRPSWRGDDGRRHTFFHIGGGDTHCTLFKAETDGLRFVYKADPRHYLSVEIPVSGWGPGTWHHVQASWFCGADGIVWAAVAADGEQRMASGGALIERLPERLYIGRRGRDLERAGAAIDRFRLSNRASLLPSTSHERRPDVSVRVNAGRDRGEFRRVHDFVTLWNSRSNPLPFQIGDAYFHRLQEAGFRWVRIVAVSENWLWGVGLSRDDEGRLVIDWSDFDRLLDLVRAAGAEPYIRLAYHVPKVMLENPAGRGWAYAPPKDLNEWSDLMYAIVKHCNVDRKLNVRYWVCSLNEGDMTALRGESDWQVVLDLYERTVKAALRADPSIKVGGPAMANCTDGRRQTMFREFLRFCRRRHLPLDFICSHAYRRVHPREYEDHVRTVKQIVKEEWPELEPEYFIDEFNQWANDRRADNEYGAAYMAAALHYQRRAGLTKSSVVSFNHFLPVEDPGGIIERHTGPFDKRQGQVARVLSQRLTCAEQSKNGLLMHPPSGARGFTFADYRVRVPRSGAPMVSFWTGVAASYVGMDGVVVRLIVDPGEHEREVFQVWQRQRAWQHHRVDLSPWSGQEIQLRWWVDAGPLGNSRADWGAIGEPRLVVTEGGKERTLFDFADRVAEAQTGIGRMPYRFEYSEETIRRYNGLPLIKGPVVTAPYFVYQMYSRMQPRRLAVELDGKDGILTDDTLGVLASRGGDTLSLLVWRFDPWNDVPRRIHLVIGGLEAPRVTVGHSVIDSTHTNPYYTYVIQQHPSPDGRYNLESGRLEVVETRTESVEAGVLHLSIEAEPLSVHLVEIDLR